MPITREGSTPLPLAVLIELGSLLDYKDSVDILRRACGRPRLEPS